MSAPILEVSTRGQTRFIPGDPTPAQTTALAKIDPDAVVRDALDRQSSTVQAYLKAVGNAAQKTVDQTPQRAPQGYSSEPELKARNTRFFFTVGAYVALAGTVAWGIVSLAQLSGAIDGAWHWPMWLAATGAMALWLVRSTHSLEAYLTPEGIEATRADADAYATEKAADGQHAIATAVAAAIQWKAESEFADSQARQLATDAAFGAFVTGGRPTQPLRRLTGEPSAETRRFAVQWQNENDTVYASQIDLPTSTPAAPQAPQSAQSATRYTVSAVQPDAGCLALCQVVAGLFDDCAARGSDLVVTRLPWSQRGEWNAAQKRQTVDVLARLDPPLLLTGDGGRVRLNVQAWVKPIALSAIRRRW